MSAKKKEKEDWEKDVETAVPMMEQPALAPKRLFLVTDAKSEHYGVNFRVIGLLEGNPDVDEDPSKVKFQHQVPRGPGRPAEIHHTCPYCRVPFPHGANLSVPATSETPQKNEILILPEAGFWKMVNAVGATLVDG